MSPTISIRLTDTEKANLEAAARLAGQTVSDYIRTSLELREQAPTIEDLQRRIHALEQLAESHQP